MLPILKAPKMNWTPAEVISKGIGVEEKYVSNVEKLFKEEHTIPFIARYRKDETGNMEIRHLYKIREELARLDNLYNKIVKAMIELRAMACLSPSLEASLLSCTSAINLEQIMLTYKPKRRKSRAQMAKEMGLEDVSLRIFNGGININLSAFVNPTGELKSLKDVVQGIINIIAVQIRNNKDVLAACDRNVDNPDNLIESCESKCKATPIDKKEKFDQYFNFKRSYGSLKPYQVMALNRGESQKALFVKVIMSERTKRNIEHQCNVVVQYVRDPDIKTRSVEEACTRLLFPMMNRRIRSRLTQKATDSSIDVFAKNLKHLLLTRPVKDTRVLAIDPGFNHGCKIAMLDEYGKALYTDKVFLQPQMAVFQVKDEIKICDIFTKYNFEMIAIGNGTGCRETEHAVTMMKEKRRLPSQMRYAIVDERGASTYSITKTAENEFPDLDENIRSAISIGRRLQDPLSEYIKVEPKHLGVGQYQHDINEKALSDRLNEVVVECVSFTGVDINTCSEHLLQKIAGLNKATARAIVDCREKLGQFTNRFQLLGVRGIGPKSFQQCAGFLRIYPNGKGDSHEIIEEEVDESELPPDQRPSHSTDNEVVSVAGKRKLRETKVRISKRQRIPVIHLDQTSIHPESYELAQKLMINAGLLEPNLGSPEFIRVIQSIDPAFVAQQFECNESRLRYIVEVLAQPLTTDYRDRFSGPIFKARFTNASDITLGTELLGRVSNVTEFGAFVDIGLHHDALLHVSQMDENSLHLGQQVKVSVYKIDQKGIGLTLICVL